MEKVEQVTWPDPQCRAHHESGKPYRAWEHTMTCKQSAPRQVLKKRRITEVVKAEDIVSRAREAGAI